MVRRGRRGWKVLAGGMVATLVAGLVAAAPVAAAGAGSYDPEIRPKDFVKHIDNPYLPLVPGTKWVYENQTDEGLERIEVAVTDETKRILGVTTTVVRDTVTLDGEVIEDTFDWYAQDTSGNVWYFGEDTHEFENGRIVNSHGAWTAGVDGAKPGIVMKAEPRVGQRYRQEHYAGVAEDRAEVLAVDETVEVPAGSFDEVVKTKDFTPLEPDLVEHKYYAPGVGVVLEVGVSSGGEQVELIEHTAP